MYPPNSSMNVLRAVLVVAATAGMILFNALAAAGRIGGVTPEQISSLYPTLVTPAGYAFSIWSLIYLGLVAYSVYQLLPSSIDRFSGIRSLYIFSCVLNCAWIYFWHGNQIGFCLVIIATLVVALIILNSQIGELPKLIDSWLVKAPFGLYLGWVTAATLVNLAVALRFWNVPMTQSTGIVLAVLLIAAASVAGIVLRWKLRNYFIPLAIAWALTAIAVQQSGNTAIVLACAAGVIASLIATLSFVLDLPTSFTSGRK